MSWIGAVDQGTTSTRFFVFDEKGKVVASARRPITLNTPRSGWVEQDPVELVDSVISCIDETCSDIDKRYGESAKKKIKAVGMANQRETVVAWDVVTGKPLHPAIVWMDSRNHEEIKRLAKTKEAVQIRRLSGLPISTYFSAGKMKWLLENVKLVQDAQRNGTLLFGTIDSWILYNLLKDRPHVTDVTNAHRTALVDLKSLKWNKTLAALQGLDLSTLPQIHPSTHTFGYFEKTKLAKVPVTAVLGDQHAALLGHGCLDPGQTKNTYGTGCFMLCNVGPKPVHTDDGLISTVAFQLGKNPSYALEASIASAASSFEWLKNKIDAVAASNSEGVIFVPALAGLLTPQWNTECSGAFLGLKMNTERSHLIKSVIDAIAFQNRKVFELMQQHCAIDQLIVDGGLSNSLVMMQTQSDVLGLPIVRPQQKEATVFGAARAAAIGAGIQEWPQIAGQEERPDVFQPTRDARNDTQYSDWEAAVDMICNQGEKSSDR